MVGSNGVTYVGGSGEVDCVEGAIFYVDFCHEDVISVGGVGLIGNSFFSQCSVRLVMVRRSRVFLLSVFFGELFVVLMSVQGRCN